MTLQLDTRQRAMLAEMGLRVWLPETAAATAVAAAAPALSHLVAGSEPSAELSPAVLRAPEPGPVPLRPGGPAGIETMDWAALATAVAACRACALGEGRRNIVFGAGDIRAEWLVVGDAPGEDEEQQGDPFVGQAGKLLDNMLRALGLNRQKGVYITNGLKCRPPGSRNPEPGEVAQCEQFLRRQVALLQPRIILAMGRFAVQSLLQSTEPIGKLRGRVHRYQGVPVIVTYHPAYLLRNLPDKAKAWADLCLAQDVVDSTPD